MPVPGAEDRGRRTQRRLGLRAFHPTVDRRLSRLEKSIDALVGHIGRISGAETARLSGCRARLALAASGSAAVAIGVAAAACLIMLWWRPGPGCASAEPAAAHSMTVRLSGFQLLSRTCLRRFGRLWTRRSRRRSAATASWAFRLHLPRRRARRLPTRWAGQFSGTADTIRVITRLINERSGATLWSSSSDYSADDASGAPRMRWTQAEWLAAGTVRASTYRRRLPIRPRRLIYDPARTELFPSPGGAPGRGWLLRAPISCGGVAAWSWRRRRACIDRSRPAARGNSEPRARGRG